MRHALETAAVVAVFIVWFALQGWFAPAAPRNQPRFTVSRQYLRRFSLRGLLIATTAMAVALGLVVWLTS